MEQLAEEFARAGADITQTFTFYNREVGTPKECSLTVSFLFLDFCCLCCCCCCYQCQEINQASCDISKKVSSKRGTIVAAGIMQTAAYKAVQGTPEGKQEVQKELSEGLEVLINNEVDAIFCEVRIIEV